MRPDRLPRPVRASRRLIWIKRPQADAARLPLAAISLACWTRNDLQEKRPMTSRPRFIVTALLLVSGGAAAKHTARRWIGLRALWAPSLWAAATLFFLSISPASAADFPSIVANVL